MHNSYGNRYPVEIWGGSHAPEIGVRIGGIPAGITIGVQDLMPMLDRRRTGAKGTSPRRESDIPFFTEGLEIKSCFALGDPTPEAISGVTTGKPLVVKFFNQNTDSSSYSEYYDHPRPGHVDFVARVRGLAGDSAEACGALEGSGQFSGRMTVAFVAAGAVLSKVCGIQASAKLIEVGGSCEPSMWPSLIDAASKDGDSLGGVVECVVEGFPAGVGEPLFDSIESVISHLIFSIPGVRGVEFGDGFSASRMKGSEHNDPILDASGRTVRNGAGGVNGGISNGNPIVFRVAFKPTSSIAKEQLTYDFKAGGPTVLRCRGRHDACFALRTPPVVEAATIIALANLL